MKNNELIRRCFVANLPLTANPGSEESDSEEWIRRRAPATGAMGGRSKGRALTQDSVRTFSKRGQGGQGGEQEESKGEHSIHRSNSSVRENSF